jgi:hypothetical protein
MPSHDVDFPSTVLDADVPGSYELFKGQAKALVDAGNAVVAGVQVIDFGQGDCTEIRTLPDQALLYVDMGGGCGKCARTNPSHPDWVGSAAHVADPSAKLNLGDDPSVVLTHWDEDHFYTAKNIPAAADLRWLVPRQKIAMSHIAFVQTLTDVRCWPAGKIRHCFALSTKVKLKIEKCSKASGGSGHKYDRNLDGLAVFLVQHVDAAGLVPGETIVLPGDAPYQYIPTLRDTNGMPPGKVIGLLAFHHGSKTHWSKRKTEAALPKVAAAPSAHKLVYTYGEDVTGVNNFNLANKQSKGRYFALGWTSREDTAGNLVSHPPLPAEQGSPPATRNDRRIDFAAPA